MARTVIGWTTCEECHQDVFVVSFGGEYAYAVHHATAEQGDKPCPSGGLRVAPERIGSLDPAIDHKFAEILIDQASDRLDE